MRNEEALCRSQSSQDELLAVARALKKQFVGNRKDSSDPAQTTAGQESGSHYSKGCGNLWGTQIGREKRKRWGLAFGGVEGLPRVCAPAYGFSAADPVFAPGRAVHSVRHEATARTRRTNGPKC